MERKKVAYLRKSRADLELEKETGQDTLKRHREIIKRHAEQCNVIIDYYYEEVVSGETIESRPEIKKLLREIEKDKMAYAKCSILEYQQKNTFLNVVLYQGLNRQIRKMFDILGHEVISLKRIQHATITLDGMKRGEYKPLKQSQIRELRTYLKKVSNND